MTWWPDLPCDIMSSIAATSFEGLDLLFGASRRGSVGRKWVPASMHASTNSSSLMSAFATYLRRSATHLDRLIHLKRLVSMSQEVMMRSDSKRRSSDDPEMALTVPSRSR